MIILFPYSFLRYLVPCRTRAAASERDSAKGIAHRVSTTLVPGTRLGPYEILEPLGAGGTPKLSDRTRTKTRTGFRTRAARFRARP